jgi:hypothetical protein
MTMTGFRAGILNELSENDGEALDLLGGGNAGGLATKVLGKSRMPDEAVDDRAAGFLGFGGGAFFNVGGVDLAGDTGDASGEVRFDAMGGGKILRGTDELAGRV